MRCIKCNSIVKEGDFCCGYLYRDGLMPFKFYRKRKKQKKPPRPKANLYKKPPRPKANLCKNYAKRAEERGLLFKLTEEDFYFLKVQPCYYCGQKGGGIDRFDSSKGYLKENCVPCCKWCNWMKSNQPYDDFINRIKLILENTNKKKISIFGAYKITQGID